MRVTLTQYFHNNSTQPSITFNVHLISKLKFGRLQYHRKHKFPKKKKNIDNYQASNETRKNTNIHIFTFFIDKTCCLLDF